MRLAAATAPSSVSTRSARGTGRPAESSRRLVRLLSEAMSTPMADVCEVIVARIRCWWTPVPELDQRVAIQPDERDVATDRLIDEGLRGRPERLALGQPDEPLQLRCEVEGERRVVRCHEMVDERDRHPARLEADRLLAVLEDAVVLPVLARRPGLAVADVGAGEVLELESDVFGDVADPGPVAKPAEEAAPPTERAGVILETGHQLDERLGEARDRLDGNSSRTPRSTSWRMTGSRAQ